ncbi:hypothetical protein LTR95_005356 [Oleoguttula sp. CCFEE 5521]
MDSHDCTCCELVDQLTICVDVRANFSSPGDGSYDVSAKVHYRNATIDITIIESRKLIVVVNKGHESKLWIIALSRHPLN